MSVGEKIRTRRKELGYTQTELAKRMGYNTKVSISNVENGRENLTTTRIRKFAEALQCPPSYLMGWSDINGEPLISEANATERKVVYTTSDPKAIKLLDLYRSIPDEKRDEFITACSLAAELTKKPTL